jgi:hypothetical protein
VTAGPAATSGEAEAEHELAARIIDTLLREDYGALASRVRLAADGPALDLPAGPGDGHATREVPLERDGFLADLRVQRTTAGRPWPPLTLDDVDSALAAIGDPLDADGVAAFAAECRQALATLRLREAGLPGARGALARLWRAAPEALAGPRGLLAY